MAVKDLDEFSGAKIVVILISSGLILAFAICMGVCAMFYGLRRGCRGRRSSNGHSTGTLIKEQSQSVLRGDHPIAFVLPTVTMSETSEFSDIDGVATGHSSSTSMSVSG